MAAKQFWLVLPLTLKIDPNKGEIFPPNEGFAQEEGPQRDRAARFRNDLLQPPPAPARPQGNGPVGFYILAGDRKHLDAAFYTHEAAMNHATDLASLSPKTPFGVFQCVGIFETAQPTILEKEFNAEGELRLKGK